MTTDNLICEGAFIQGNVILGHGNVLHPRSEIKSNIGPIVIGNDNIFEEHVLIQNDDPSPLIIGNGNHFQVSCQMKGKFIGSDCLIGPKTVLERVIVNDQSVIGPSMEVSDFELEKQFAFVSNCPPHPIQTMDDKQHARHLEYLREVLPKYHHLKQYSNPQ